MSPSHCWLQDANGPMPPAARASVNTEHSWQEEDEERSVSSSGNSPTTPGHVSALGKPVVSHVSSRTCCFKLSGAVAGRAVSQAHLVIRACEQMLGRWLLDASAAAP